MRHEKHANCCFIKAVYKNRYCSAWPSLGGTLLRVEVLCLCVPGCVHWCKDWSLLHVIQQYSITKIKFYGSWRAKAIQKQFVFPSRRFFQTILLIVSLWCTNSSNIFMKTMLKLNGWLVWFKLNLHFYTELWFRKWIIWDFTFFFLQTSKKCFLTSCQMTSHYRVALPTAHYVVEGGIKSEGSSLWAHKCSSVNLRSV